MSGRFVIRNESSDAFAEVDELANQLVTIEATHHRVHEGAFFSLGVASGTLANNASLEILIQTPADFGIHMRGIASCGGDATIDWFEGTTFSAAGTAITPANRNRQSANVARGTWTHTPTLTADGTSLFSTYILGGTGGNATGGSTGIFEEWILDQSQTYLLRLTNISGLVKVATLNIDFYDPSFEQE